MSLNSPQTQQWQNCSRSQLIRCLPPFHEIGASATPTINYLCIAHPLFNFKPLNQLFYIFNSWSEQGFSFSTELFSVRCIAIIEYINHRWVSNIIKYLDEAMACNPLVESHKASIEFVCVVSQSDQIFNNWHLGVKIISGLAAWLTIEWI